MSRDDMGASVEGFPFAKLPAENLVFCLRPCMEALNIFSYSKAIAAIEVVILFKISSSISIKKNYFDSLLISNAVLIEAEGLRIACLADYKYQPNKIYTLKSIKKKHTLQLHVNTTHN